jgi:hypothetical protein
VKDTDYEYSPLDRYLMGLAEPSEVGDLRVLRNIQPPLHPLVTRHRATEVRIPVEAIIRAAGRRSPAMMVPQTFSVVFVAIAPDLLAAEKLAGDVDKMRPSLEQAFERATGGRATIVTELSYQPRS